MTGTRADVSGPMKAILEELQALMPGSHKLAEKHGRVLAQEVVGTVNIPYAFYVQSAKGSHVTDVDGREYIDLTMGFGPLLLGHNPDVAVEAARETAEDVALHLGLPNPYQGELGELVVEASPCADKVAFYNSGTEATMYAIRAARAYSGKTKVAVFVGSYHGAHDYVLARAEPSESPDGLETLPLGHGIPRETLDQLLVLPYRNSFAFDLIRKHKDELALVMIEPVQSSNPRVDVGPFLQELRSVCSESGVLLLLDEVITGFRLGYRRAQDFFGVKADLASFGKVLGGGMPIGAVAGSDDVMGCFSQTRKGSEIFSGGTFCGNPMSMRVGSAVLRTLRAKPEIYSRLASESERLANAINGFCEAEGMPARLMNAQSQFKLVFTDQPVNSAWDLPSPHSAEAELEKLFYAHLHRNGVVVPGVHIFFLSAAHTPDDVDAVSDAFQKSFLELREAGVL